MKTEMFRNLLFLIGVALFSCSKNTENNCLVDHILAYVALSVTTVIAGQPTDIPLVFEVVSCAPFSGTFTANFKVMQDSTVIESRNIPVMFDQTNKVTITTSVLFSAPGEYRFSVCPDIYHEIPARIASNCQ